MSDHHPPVRSPAGRRSRMGWPLRTGATTTAAGTHDHEMPRPRWVLRAFIAFGLALVLVIVGELLQIKRSQSLTEYRNQQQQQIEQDMRQGFCDLLDQLPQSAVLDAPRRKYGCGPGIPFDQLPPSVRQHWGAGQATTAPSSSAVPQAAPSTTAQPAVGPLSGAGSSRTRPSDQPVGARPSDAPPPTPASPDPVLCHLVPAACQLEVP